MTSGMAGLEDPLVIRNANVIDGSGSPAFPADILISHGVIVAIEAAGSVVSSQLAGIDVDGLIVSPGFIDVHSHADGSPLLPHDDLTKISQGVTTEVTGNCGFSLAPVRDDLGTAQTITAMKKFFTLDFDDWHTTADLFHLLDTKRSVTNTCPLVGHHMLRLAAMGPNARVASGDDVARMGSLLQEALAAGVFGMSTGLIYPPGVYSDTAEVASLAAYLPPDRVYATHMRNESFDLLGSVQEALTIGRKAGCRVQISHLKAAGRANHGMVVDALAALDQARDSGVPVTQDVYPYDAASTVLTACLPPWAHDGGHEATLRSLRDPQALASLQRDIEAESGSWENPIHDAGGYDGILIAATRSHHFEGRTLLQIGEDLHVSPFEALVRVLVEEDLNATTVEFSMSEDDVDAVLRSPMTMIGSDGLPPGGGGRPHPRLFGTFPRVLARYVRQRHVLELPEAIRRMTSLPAETFGIPNRGRVVVGAVADLVCFDPQVIDHPGDYVSPDVPPVGIAWVMQAGHVVMKAGVWGGVRRGSRLEPA